MATVFLKRIGNALYPDGDASIAAVELLPFERTLKAEVTQPRSLPHHKLFWALCARIGQGIGKSAEWVADAFKVETKNFDIFSYGGKPHVVLRSIAFHKMDQIQFTAFFNECVQIAYREWKIDPADISDLLVREDDNQPA